MSNEELAVTAKGGDTNALLDLWSRVRRLAWRFIPRWRAAARKTGGPFEGPPAHLLCFFQFPDFPAMSFYNRLQHVKAVLNIVKGLHREHLFLNEFLTVS